MRHLAKFERWGWSTLGDRLLPLQRLSKLAALQLELLQNGFRQLRAGGTLVYSTCSFARAQNEDIVEAFLRDEPLYAPSVHRNFLFGNHLAPGQDGHPLPRPASSSVASRELRCSDSVASCGVAA